jgi:tRNA (guanine-N7-)-methyltransferase
MPPPYPRKTRPDDPYADARFLPGDHDAIIELETLLPAAEGGKPIELEIGGGRGAFAYERVAVLAPEGGCLLGLEIKRKWATIVDRKLHALGVEKRARCFAEDARLALPRLRPDGRLRAVFLHFPDPWWKKRHEKRLVMGDVVQSEIERLLAPGGELFVQTDVAHRAEQYRAFLDTRTALAPKGDREGDPTLGENPYGARSPREKRAIVDGIPIFRMRYQKRA